jgi:hypothetical protein
LTITVKNSNFTRIIGWIFYYAESMPLFSVLYSLDTFLHLYSNARHLDGSERQNLSPRCPVVAQGSAAGGSEQGSGGRDSTVVSVRPGVIRDRPPDSADENGSLQQTIFRKKVCLASAGQVEI